MNIRLLQAACVATQKPLRFALLALPVGALIVGAVGVGVVLCLLAEAERQVS